MYPPRVFKCRAKELRESRGWTQDQVAAKLKITPLTYRRIEDGADTKLKVAFALAKLFDLTVSDVWVKA